MEDNTMRGLMVLLGPKGEISHQFIGSLSQVEVLGISKYVDWLPQKGQLDLHNQTLSTALQGLLEVLIRTAATQTEEKKQCGPESSLESSPSLDSLSSTSKPPASSKDS